MSDIDDPVRFAPLIAPAVDRLTIAIHTAVDRQAVAALRGDHAFSPGHLALVAAALATGRMARADLDRLTRYEHFGPSQDFVDGLAARGAVTLDDGDLVATAAAQEVARSIVELQLAAAESLWAPRVASWDRAEVLAARAVAAAVTDSPLAAYAAGGWRPADASAAGRLWLHLGALRLHRADAHARAWSAEGRTAAEMKLLGPGPDRDRIEAATNVAAATPWGPLAPGERLELLAVLAGLSGVGAGV